MPRSPRKFFSIFGRRRPAGSSPINPSLSPRTSSNKSLSPLERRRRRTRRILVGTGLGALALTAGMAIHLFRGGKKPAPTIGPRIHVVEKNSGKSQLVNSAGNVIGEFTRKPLESEKEFRARVEQERNAREQGPTTRPESRPVYDARLIPRPPGKFPAYPPLKALEYIQREHPGLIFSENPQKKITPQSLVEIEWNWQTTDPTGKPVLIPQRTFVFASAVNGNEVMIEQGGPTTNSPEFAADKAAGQKATYTGLAQYLKSIGGKVVGSYPSQN